MADDCTRARRNEQEFIYAKGQSGTPTSHLSKRPSEVPGHRDDLLILGYDHGAPLLRKCDIGGVVSRETSSAPMSDSDQSRLADLQAEKLKIAGKRLELIGFPPPPTGGDVQQLEKHQRGHENNQLAPTEMIVEVARRREMLLTGGLEPLNQDR